MPDKGAISDQSVDSLDSVCLDIDTCRQQRPYRRREYLGRVLWSLATPLFRFSPRPLFGWRRLMLRLFGARIGRSAHVYASARIYLPWNLTLGDQAEELVDEFEFVGAVDGQEKTALCQSADLFVLPTFSENFGVVVAEALACGVPVITTTGAPWQILETHGCGWWVETGTDALVAALREATRTDSEVLRKMGERGRLYAEEAFGWSAIAENMLAVYRWMLGHGDLPECVQLD